MTATGVSRICVAIVVAAALVQVGDLFVEIDPWIAMGALYLSSAAIGVDAIAVGVRKHEGEGISIRNLAPGGWTIFAGMFWILAIPAYFAGARRRVDEAGAREPVLVGSWVSIGVFGLLGLVLLLVGVAR